MLVFYITFYYDESFLYIYFFLFQVTTYLSRGVGRAVSGAAVLSKGDMGSPERGVSYSPGVTDALYSLSTLKTVCAWRRAIPYAR